MNFLTSGRTALLQALQSHEILSARIKTWIEMGPGLQARLIVDPGHCPLCCVAPVENKLQALANILRDIPQDIQVDFSTDGQDAAPMEELLAALYDVVLAQEKTALGLSAVGLCRVSVTGTLWEAQPDKDGARMIWQTTTRVELWWKRIAPLSDLAAWTTAAPTTEAPTTAGPTTEGAMTEAPTTEG